MKRETTEVIEQPNQENIRTLGEKENIGSGQTKMKEKNKNVDLRKLIKYVYLETKFYNRNLIKEINTPF